MDSGPATGSPNADPQIHRFWELSGELFCLADQDGVLLQVNPAWTRTLGWAEEQLVGRSLLDLVLPEDTERTRVELASDPHPDAHGELRLRHRDGSVRWLQWSARLEDGRWTGVGRDVTAMRMSQDVLRRSERRSRAIVSTMRDALFVVDPNGRIVEAAGSAEAMFGRPAHELVGQRPPYPWWPASEHNAIGEELRRALRGETHAPEFTLIRRSGEPFRVTVDAAPLNEGGGPPLTLFVLRDITEVAATRDRLAHAHRIAGILSWEYDPRTRRLSFFENPLRAAQTDAHIDETLDAMGPDQHGAMLRMLDEVARGERASGVMEALLTGQDGIDWVEMRVRPIHDGDGRIIGVRGTTQRIDDRKQAQYERRMQWQLLDELEMAIVARGPDSLISFVNDAATRLFGFTREEVDGRDPRDLPIGDPNDPVVRDLLDAMRDGRSWQGDLTMRRKDGSPVRVRYRNTIVRDERGMRRYSAALMTRIDG